MLRIKFSTDGWFTDRNFGGKSLHHNTHCIYFGLMLKYGPEYYCASMINSYSKKALNLFSMSNGAKI